jgi:hypothetical protein
MSGPQNEEQINLCWFKLPPLQPTVEMNTFIMTMDKINGEKKVTSKVHWIYNKSILRMAHQPWGQRMGHGKWNV